MIDRKLFKVPEPDDPRRCQAVIPQGQCSYIANEDSNYCLMHGGAIAAKGAKNLAVRNYRLQRYQARVNELADSEGVKSLREEIGIARMLLEETINKCESDADLAIFIPTISDLIMKIEKLVVSCHKLESSLGHMLDKTAVLNISTQIVNIVSELVPDENLIDQIVSKILQLVGGTNDLARLDSQSS